MTDDRKARILAALDIYEWAALLLPHWEAFGPWVPDDSLPDAGRECRDEFLKLLTWDARALPFLRAAVAELERRLEDHP